MPKYICPTKWHPSTFEGVEWGVKQLVDKALDPRTVAMKAKGLLLPETWRRVQDMYYWYAKGRPRQEQMDIYELYQALRALTEVRGAIAVERRELRLRRNRNNKLKYRQPKP